MNNRLATTLLIAAAALSFSSCKPEPSTAPTDRTVHTITFTVDAAGTKSALSGDSWVWTEKDAARFHVTENSLEAVRTEVNFSADKKTAEVRADFKNTTANSYTYNAFISGSDSPCIPQKQICSVSSFDPATDLLIADPVTYDTPVENVGFAFRRVGALCRLDISGLAPGETVRELAINSDDETLCGVYDVNYHNFFSIDGNLMVQCQSTADAAGTASVEFICCPIRSSRLSYLVVTDSGSYESKPEQKVTLEADGKINTSTVAVQTETLPESDAADMATLKTLLTDVSQTFHCYMKDVTVTAICGANAYIQDATGGMYLYNCAGSLNVGDSFSGEMSFTGVIYSSSKQKEITAYDFSRATKATGVSVEPVEMTLKQIADDLQGEQRYDGCLAVTKGVTAATSKSGTGDVNISQDGTTVVLYARASVNVEAGKSYDVKGFPLNYRGTKLQIVVMNSSDVVAVDSPDPGPDPDVPDNPDVPGTNDFNGWLELPARSPANPSYYYGTFYGTGDYATSGKGTDRNYTYLYDKSTYTSYWVAYPLYKATMGGSRSGSWQANPAIPESDQVNVWNCSYNVAYGDTNWSSNATNSDEYYARGHQIPDADRSGNSTMQTQTYFATNSTPQIQNDFNAGVWMYLEGAVRDYAKTTDTLYVVTGASLKTVGGNETVTYIYPKGDSGKATPVPNYYWKVLLKVKRASDGTVTNALALGYWLKHERIKTHDYSDYAVSVAEIEEKTGFDFFANLPGDNNSGIEQTAQKNDNSNAFYNF